MVTGYAMMTLTQRGPNKLESMQRPLRMRLPTHERTNEPMDERINDRKGRREGWAAGAGAWHERSGGACVRLFSSLASASASSCAGRERARERERDKEGDGESEAKANWLPEWHLMHTARWTAATPARTTGTDDAAIVRNMRQNICYWFGQLLVQLRQYIYLPRAPTAHTPHRPRGDGKQ